MKDKLASLRGRVVRLTNSANNEYADNLPCVCVIGTLEIRESDDEGAPPSYFVRIANTAAGVCGVGFPLRFVLEVIPSRVSLSEIVLKN